MFKKIVLLKEFLIPLLFLIVLVCSAFVIANGGGEDDFEEAVEHKEVTGGAHATIEYLYDVEEMDKYFVRVKWDQGSGWPALQGTGVETNVYTHIRLRGVSVPRKGHIAEERNRPHIEVARERERCNYGIRYVWGLVGQNNSVRLYNPVRGTDGIILCDVKFLLGGYWQNLASYMISDERAHPDLKGYYWDWGSVLVGMRKKV